MIIAGIYSFNNGEDVIRSQYPAELEEVEQVVAAVDSTQCKTKTSREKTMPGRTLYNPRALNRAFAKEFGLRGWGKYKVKCDYPADYYVSGFVPDNSSKGAFRERISSKTAWVLKFNLANMLLWSTTFAPR